MNRHTIGLLISALVLIVPFSLMYLYEPVNTVQAGANLRVMKSVNLWSGLESYPKMWPPLYPTLLWSVHVFTGLSAQTINTLLLSFGLLLMLVFCWRYIESHYYFVPVVLFAINNAVYYNSGFFSSEFLLLPLVFLLLLQLGSYFEGPNIRGVLLLGVLTGVIGLTRYFGIIWIFPTVILSLWLVAGPFGQKVRHTVYYGLAALLICVPWFVNVYMKTGHLTGMDRSATRVIPEGMGITSMNFSQGPGVHLQWAMKTAVYDLFSSHHVASYKSLLVTNLNRYDYGFALLLLLVLALLAMQALKLVWSARRSVPPSPGYLPALFALSYIATLISVWSFGNNDPIFTRFLFPFYPLLLLAAYSVYVGAGVSGRLRTGVRLFIGGTSLIYLVNMALEVARVLAIA